VNSTWSVYAEASTVTTAPQIRAGGNGATQTAKVTVPADAAKGQRIVRNLR
jgi:hypothetical protein